MVKVYRLKFYECQHIEYDFSYDNVIKPLYYCEDCKEQRTVKQAYLRNEI